MIQADQPLVSNKPPKTRRNTLQVACDSVNKLDIAKTIQLLEHADRHLQNLKQARKKELAKQVEELTKEADTL